MQCLNNLYSILMVPEPSRREWARPKISDIITEWVRVDLLDAERYLQDKALEGFIFEDTEPVEEQLELRPGQKAVVINEKVML